MIFLKWLITQEASQVYCTILTNFKQDIKRIKAHLQHKKQEALWEKAINKL